MACFSDVELLKRAVREVLTDEGFQLPTEGAQAALKSAGVLLGWISTKDASTFSTKLLGSLRGCFPTPRKSRKPGPISVRSVRTSREIMWENFFKLTTSESFRREWEKVLNDVKVVPCPIFYQFITDCLMRELIKEKFPLQFPGTEHGMRPLDYDEKNALRYTAGYVMRAVKKKLLKSAHPLVKGIRICIEEMLEMNQEDDGEFV